MAPLWTCLLLILQVNVMHSLPYKAKEVTKDQKMNLEPNTNNMTRTRNLNVIVIITVDPAVLPDSEDFHEESQPSHDPYAQSPFYESPHNDNLHKDADKHGLNTLETLEGKENMTLGELYNVLEKKVGKVLGAQPEDAMPRVERSDNVIEEEDPKRAPPGSIYKERPLPHQYNNPIFNNIN